jgi:cytoskeletal protein CcmA (bactofilin family)
MEPDKDTAPTTEGDEQKNEQDAPADALSRTPDDLEEEKAEQVAASGESKSEGEPEKKISPIKKLFRRLNVYFLIFILMTVIAIVIVVVNYLNSQKVTPPASIATQNLNQDTLKQLANTDASVGNTSQTLTIQGNAVIAGQTLLRGNLNVAGNIQSGGSITGPSLTISGTSNLGATQINSLQVAQNTAIQGSTTLKDLNVSGTSSFSGPITASQITTSNLILSGNAKLQVPNHIAFTGPSPGRSMNAGVLGAGGSSSINGSDTTGTINLNTGNGPVAGCFVHITFSQAFTSQPHVIVSPIGAGAAQSQYYVNRSTTGFDLCTVNAPPANSVFAYDYFVTG